MKRPLFIVVVPPLTDIPNDYLHLGQINLAANNPWLNLLLVQQSFRKINVKPSMIWLVRHVYAKSIRKAFLLKASSCCFHTRRWNCKIRSLESEKQGERLAGGEKTTRIPESFSLWKQFNSKGAIKHYMANVRKLYSMPKPLIKLFYIIYSLKPGERIKKLSVGEGVRGWWV